VIGKLRRPRFPAEASQIPGTVPVAEKVTFSRYSVRLANCPEDRIAACRLRFKVFNIELGEGLSSSYSTGLDEDHFDMVCDHLLVEDQNDRHIVGPYRMQSGLTASVKLGYYSAREFEFAPYEGIRHQVLELGRASIDRQHRSGEVLTLLWRGIARYARLFGLRYLIGCSSLPSQDPLLGWTLYQQFSPFLVREEFCTVPTAAFALPTVDGRVENPVTPPKLLRTYLGIGAKICGPPGKSRSPPRPFATIRTKHRNPGSVIGDQWYFSPIFSAHSALNI
jgi:putative hemolysin